MQTISFARRDEKWAVDLDDHDTQVKEEILSQEDRGVAVERALLEARTRGLDLAEPMPVPQP